jgi:hypothetical protein
MRDNVDGRPKLYSQASHRNRHTILYNTFGVITIIIIIIIIICYIITSLCGVTTVIGVRFTTSGGRPQHPAATAVQQNTSVYIYHNNITTGNSIIPQPDTPHAHTTGTTPTDKIYYYVFVYYDIGASVYFIGTALIITTYTRSAAADPNR